jgi:CubicO group peptidase (beta-lactamase class C family)
MRRLLAVLAVALAPAIAEAAPPAGFDKRVEAVRQRLDAAGFAVSIVEEGKVTLSKGFGVKHLPTGQKVDTDTLFQIGSVSKHFTAAALATLVDEGKLKWDDPVIDHLPDFRMYDPWVTREMTVRDLLVHRSGLGLGQGDLMMVPATTISRPDLVRRLRYLKPATSFRSAYAYDNVLYAVAGQLIEAKTGQTWEVYVRDRLLKPAGMANSVTNDPDRWVAPNRALPHGQLGELRGMGPQVPLDEKGVSLGQNSAPAGAIASSANDMARWIQVQLAEGRAANGAQVFSAASAREMWKPVVLLNSGPLPGALAEASPQFSTYALGWNVKDYRGHKIISHGGGTLGFRAVAVLIPEKNVGFAMMVNSEENAMIPALTNELLDHYLGLPKRDWVTAYDDFMDKRMAEGLKAVRASQQERPASKPSLPLAGYAGTYADPWYGPIAVKDEGGKLVIDFLQTPGMTAPLEHWAYDTFVARWKDRITEPAYVTFNLDAAGKPARISMKAVSPVADFSYDYHDLDFRPVAAAK